MIFLIFIQENILRAFILTQKALRRLIDKTLFFSFNRRNKILFKWYLHSIKEKEEEVLRAVATDGHRLSRLSATLPKNANNLEELLFQEKLSQK